MLVNDLKWYGVLNGGLLKRSLPNQVAIQKYSFWYLGQYLYWGEMYAIDNFSSPFPKFI